MFFFFFTFVTQKESKTCVKNCFNKALGYSGDFVEKVARICADSLFIKLRFIVSHFCLHLRLGQLKK